MSQKIKLKYYDKFKCIAGACSFSCCQEWKIGVDSETYLKWQGKKQQGILLNHYVKRKLSGSYIMLNNEKKCPFLNKDKLCKVVLEFGEDHLSKTCTVFPREINTFKSRTEYALDPGCPAVIDLMNLEDEPMTLVFEQNLDENSNELEKDILFSMRQMMLSIMQKEKYTLPQRLMMIFYALLELQEKEHLSLEAISACESDAFLEPISNAVKQMHFEIADSIHESNELFLDVVENYRKQKLYVDYLEVLSCFAEALEDTYEPAVLIEKYKCYEKELYAYEELMQKYLVSELFGNVLMEETELEDMIIAFQWIAMTYGVIRQSIFLKWLMQEEKLTYEMVRDYMMIISRVTGYEQSDIREYLENSFEDVIWEWGYLALVTGNGKL